VSKKTKNHSESTPDEFEESVQQKTPLGVNVKWRSTASPHDFPAAANYLSLLAEPKLVDEIVARLKKAEVSHYRANDILRAADLALLDMGDASVRRDLAKQLQGISWAPVMLVRGQIGLAHPLTIADGYHRVCASYHLNEDLHLPCLVADLPT
jgi:hypothetical protein